MSAGRPTRRPAIARSRQRPRQARLQRPPPKKKHRGTQNETKETMDQDVPAEISEEIESLMTRLAALKDKHGL